MVGVTLQDIVPVPSRSPGRRLQPVMVWCAIICCRVQYLHSNCICHLLTCRALIWQCSLACLMCDILELCKGFPGCRTLPGCSRILSLRQQKSTWKTHRCLKFVWVIV